MQLVYIYDIKAPNKREFNRVKRMFYYYLNKLGLKDAFRTKSVIAVEPKKEKLMDEFFKQFGRNIEVYKIFAQSIELL